MHRVFVMLTFAVLALAANRDAAGHFPWIAVSNDGKAIYFFGETPADRTYKLPSSVESAKVHLSQCDSQSQSIELRRVDSDDFVGLISNASIPESALLTSKVTYGVYHGSRLDYYSQHQRGPIPSNRAATGALAKQLDLHAEVIDTDSGVDVFVLWKGKPLADVEVRLFCEEGHEEGLAKTDANGKVSFDDKQVEDGLNGIMVGHTSAGESGSIGDQKYQSVSHYLTATFTDPQDFED